MNNPPSNSTPVNNGLNGTTTYWYQPIQTMHNNIIVPEIIDNRQNIPEYLKMNNAECLKLLKLLNEWKLNFLFRTLYDALVDIEALKYITPNQCEVLLGNYPLGIRIKFTGKVMEWKHLVLAELINNNNGNPM